MRAKASRGPPVAEAEALLWGYSGLLAEKAHARLLWLVELFDRVPILERLEAEVIVDEAILHRRTRDDDGDENANEDVRRKRHDCAYHELHVWWAQLHAALLPQFVRAHVLEASVGQAKLEWIRDLIEELDLAPGTLSRIARFFFWKHGFCPTNVDRSS